MRKLKALFLVFSLFSVRGFVANAQPGTADYKLCEAATSGSLDEKKINCHSEPVPPYGPIGAEFSNGAKSLTLWLAKGPKLATWAKGSCTPAPVLGEGAIRCEIIGSDLGDFTVILRNYNGEKMASVFPRGSGQAPTFFPCKSE